MALADASRRIVIRKYFIVLDTHQPGTPDYFPGFLRSLEEVTDLHTQKDGADYESGDRSPHSKGQRLGRKVPDI
jgi:hypothetical protein